MMTTVRLDKWLWAARFYKTRALATKAIQHGKIKIDNQKPKPARPIIIGTIIQIETPLYEKTIRVMALGEKRQGAAIVQSWYEETEESIQKGKAAQEKQQTERLMYKTAPNPIKKPDKHSRRALKEVKRRGEED
tara:strand:+ start:29733 stop:30134 length:402 start_codon:yes stop_codon:yes gene_type:complete